MSPPHLAFVGKGPVKGTSNNGKAPTMSLLRRYTLSYILSYLSETDGTAFLITNRYYNRRILPMYELPSSKQLRMSGRKNVTTTTNNIDDGDSSIRMTKRFMARHRFMVFPVEDPEVLLERLNTRRLKRRLVIQLRKKNGRGSKWKAKESACGDDINLEGKEEEEEAPSPPYRYGMTTEQLALHEWDEQRELFMHSSFQTKIQTDQKDHHASGTLPGATAVPLSQFCCRHHRWSSDLELLRFGPSTTAQPYPTLLASYPRSGNTLLRSLLERTTLQVTGSDTRPDRTLSRSLSLHHNLVGEGVVQSQEIGTVIKTHFPERRGCLPYRASRVILLIRNPYDAIDSYWNMCLTNTHTESVTEEINMLYEDKFVGMAKSEIRTWLSFHYYWLDMCQREEEGVDLLLVRYEDLVMQTERELCKIVKFVLGKGEGGEELDEFWLGRVHHALGRDGTGDKGKRTLEKSQRKGIHDGVKSTNDSMESESYHDVTNNDVNNNDNQSVCKEEDCRIRAESASTSPSNNNGGMYNNTSNLGSYRPRAAADQSSSGSGGGGEGGVTSMIGKSIAKGRYSHETLRHIHRVAASFVDGNTEENDTNGSLATTTTMTDMTMTDMTLLQRFGYDIYTQNFPHNFASENNNSSTNNEGCGTANGSKSLTSSESIGSNIGKKTKKKGDMPYVLVNVGSEIRPPDDPYGRAMTNWRKGETEGDRRPFPTVPRGGGGGRGGVLRGS